MRKRTREGSCYTVNFDAFFRSLPPGRRPLTREDVAKAQRYRRKLLDEVLADIDETERLKKHDAKQQPS